MHTGIEGLLAVDGLSCNSETSPAASQNSKFILVVFGD